MLQRLGPYEVLGKIGEGGKGAVYRARDEAGRVVAIKTILTQDAAGRKRFEREMMAAARLRHPNIVTFFDWAPDAEAPYLVMEYVDGESLRDRMKRGILPVKEAVRVLGEVAAALDYAHKKGIIHRDVKPENVLLSRGGPAKLADFGLAQVSGEASLTASHIRVGTPKFIAPEIWRGEPARPRSDQFSLGVMAFYLLTGSRPFDADSLIGLMSEIAVQPPPKPSSMHLALTRRIDPVILRALAKDPEERFENCAAFVAALEGAFRATDERDTGGGAAAGW